MPIDYQVLLDGGKHWSTVVHRGTSLTLEDVEGGANAAMLLYNSANFLERYNAPDTLKCQHTFKLARGHCLYSDMGRIFCCIVEDTLGWHDTVCGTTNEALIARRWGAARYQEVRNDWKQNGRAAFLVEAAKYGMGRRDLAANLNWFSKVTVSDGGALSFEADHSKAGSSITLRFEMDTLVLINTCPHPLNPATDYPRRPVRILFAAAQMASESDLYANSRAEVLNGLENNRLYHLHACNHRGR